MEGDREPALVFSHSTFRKIFVAKCQKGMTLLEPLEKQPLVSSVCVKKLSHGFENLGRADIPQIFYRSEPQSARPHPWRKSIRRMELQLPCHRGETAERRERWLKRAPRARFCFLIYKRGLSGILMAYIVSEDQSPLRINLQVQRVSTHQFT